MRLTIISLMAAFVHGSMTDIGTQLPSEDAGNTRQLLEEVGSGISVPPPPAPFSPPGPPGAQRVTEYTTKIKMLADGTVESVTNQIPNVQQAFATESKVPLENVTVTVQAASVLIAATIQLNSTNSMKTATQALKNSLASTSAANSFFASNGITGIKVISTPVVYADQGPVILYPPPPPASDDGLDGGAIAGIVIGSLAGAGLLIGGGWYYMKNKEQSAAKLTIPIIDENA